MEGLFKIVFEDCGLLDGLGPHEHGADEVDVETGGQGEPVDQVNVDLQVVQDGRENPREDYAAEIVAGDFTHATDVDEILGHQG